jgi:hypothetical protein
VPDPREQRGRVMADAGRRCLDDVRGAFWTDRPVRLRGIEPEDWSAFMEFDRYTDHQRSVDMTAADPVTRWRLIEGRARPPNQDHARSRKVLGEARARPHFPGSCATWNLHPNACCRLGFVEKGRLRDHEFLAVRHHEVVVMGMTAAEFAARYAVRGAVTARLHCGTRPRAGFVRDSARTHDKEPPCNQHSCRPSVDCTSASGCG